MALKTLVVKIDLKFTEKISQPDLKIFQKIDQKIDQKGNFQNKKRYFTRNQELYFGDLVEGSSHSTQ